MTPPRLTPHHLLRAADRELRAADALLLSAGAVARQLGVSGRTVRRWIEAGKCDAIQTDGGHWRIYRSELARLLTKSRTIRPAHLGHSAHS